MSELSADSVAADSALHAKACITAFAAGHLTSEYAPCADYMPCPYWHCARDVGDVQMREWHQDMQRNQPTDSQG